MESYDGRCIEILCGMTQWGLLSDSDYLCGELPRYSITRALGSRGKRDYIVTLSPISGLPTL